MNTEDIEAHVLKKYEIVQKIGKGSRGTVWMALHKRKKEVVALKKWSNALSTVSDAQKTYREAALLNKVRKFEGIVGLRKVIKAHNKVDLYLVFEYMETDLQSAIKANSLEEIHKQYIIYQILKALKYLHSQELIHRNLRPCKILLNSQCEAKLIGFRLASSDYSLPPELSETDLESGYTYLPPEALSGSSFSSRPFDMWQVGCLLGELLVGKPIFKGTSVQNQLEKILDVIGKPLEESAKKSPTSTVIRPKKTLKDIAPNISEDAIDFLRKIFMFDPKDRLSVDDCLKHRYMETFYKRDSFVLEAGPKTRRHSREKSFAWKEMALEDLRNLVYALAEKDKERKEEIIEKITLRLTVTEQKIETKVEKKESEIPVEGKNETKEDQMFMRIATNGTAAQKPEGQAGKSEENRVEPVLLETVQGGSAKKIMVNDWSFQKKEKESAKASEAKETNEKKKPEERKKKKEEKESGGAFGNPIASFKSFLKGISPQLKNKGQNLKKYYDKSLSNLVHMNQSMTVAEFKNRIFSAAKSESNQSHSFQVTRNRKN